MSTFAPLPRELEEKILALGDGTYSHLRYIDGKVCGLGRQIFTWSLMVDMGDTLHGLPYDRRYCYQHKPDAMRALMFWDGQGDPPGPWVKMKGHRGEKLGPGALEGA